MRKEIISGAALCLMLACAAPQASAQLKGSTLGKMIEGVFNKSDLKLEELAGEWTASGSAVCFQSENFLKKAGGIAAAATVESKLDPYFRQYGLTGSVFTIQTDGSFTMVSGRINLSGTIARNDDGTFAFSFRALGKIPVGTVTAYVEKTSRSMDVMFDASKLQSLLSAIGKFSGIKTVQAVGDILNSYEGICVGFRLEKSGSVEGEKKSGLDSLFDALGGKGKGSSSDSVPDKQTTPADTTKQASGAEGLLNILKGKGKGK